MLAGERERTHTPSEVIGTIEILILEKMSDGSMKPRWNNPGKVRAAMGIAVQLYPAQQERKKSSRSHQA